MLQLGRTLRQLTRHMRSVKMSAVQNQEAPFSSTPSAIKGYDFENPETQKFLNDIHKLMVEEGLVKSVRKDSKVIEFQHPADLEKLLDLDIGDHPEGQGRLIELCKNVIQHSVKTGNVGFYNQLYTGINAYGLSGAWLTETLNTNLHTYEVAPVFVVMEKYMISKLCKIVGFENGDGVFGPGGSFCNIMGLNLARFKANPDTKTTGLYSARRMRMYASQEAHYSLKKGAALLGMGTENVIAISTDDKGCMIPEVLEQKILEDKKQGYLPILTMATAGTTVLGAYDPLKELSDVCRRHGVWLHCDACWGGRVLLSKQQRHLMDGVERVDSMSWNFHKMSGFPLQCSVILVKEKGLLEACNKQNAEYLFQPDKFYDVAYDIGDKTVQCGRKVDVLKLWLQWKAMGDVGMSACVDNSFDNARYLAEQMEKTEGFRLVIPEFQCTNVCFWYIPKSLRGQEETPEWWNKVAKVAPQVKERMVKEGVMMIGYNPLSTKGLVNFFRIIIENAIANHSDMDNVISVIDRLGRDL